MVERSVHAVTGAFGYSGKYIAECLLEAGQRVKTLTNSPHRANPFGGRVEVHPFNFDDPARLVRTLEDVSVLYNTYWVRFNYKTFTFARAIGNLRTLFACAHEAGVERIVHVSITNPSPDSPFEYFRGKAAVEKALVDSGVPHAILRPAVLFGKEDILVNNIAWMLRHVPVFGIFGDGGYRLQPIHVDDLVELAVAEGHKRRNVVIDAIGPETFTYRGLVETIAEIIGRRRPLISIPPLAGYLASRFMGVLVRDVIVTRDEIGGLMADLLCVDSPPAGTIKLTDWARRHADSLGRHYASELARRKNRLAAYKAL